MKIAKSLLVMMLVVLLGAAAGCKKEIKEDAGGKAEKAAAGSKKIVIALIAKSSTNPVFLSAKTGAEASAKDLSKKHGIDVQIRWLTPPNEDGTVQAQRIAQAVNEGANAILIACSDAGKVTGAINDAVGRGVPVMTFDSDAPDSKRFAFYGVDDMKTGELVMDTLAKAMNGKGTIGILAGNQNAPNLRNRVQGVLKAKLKYPDIKVKGTYYHIETPSDAAQKVDQVNKANPDINGWAMIGGWPLFTQSLLDTIDPAKMKIVAVDALPAELIYVEKDIAPVLLAQPTYLWGYVSVEKIVDKIYLNKEVPEFNQMDLVVVNKETLGSWARQLKEWGFEDVPQKYIDMK